jgi:cobalt/nickel transport system permease protein
VHLADGIISPTPVVIALNIAGVALVGATLRTAFERRRCAAWTGTMAAFVLAAQALNVPMVPGASAHAIGAGLLALTLGPARAIVALFAVLLVQALLLGDGGITVIGINALNIAVLPVACVHACRKLFGETPRAVFWAALVGTPLGSVLGAACLGAVLVQAAHAPFAVTFGWLIGVQAVAGVVEGVISAAAVKHLLGRAPALLRVGMAHESDERDVPSRRALWVTAFAVAVTLALLPFASAMPDALEVVVEHLKPQR